MAGSGGVNMEQFEAFFQRADLDRDGRISGAEAVNFFRGSNLPQQVLAQIWTHADRERSGFLSRPAFYNALKLVTVAQSKRELTDDIVKRALYSPASAQIPPPKINLAAIPGQQPNSVASPPTGAPALPSSQNLGFRGQSPASTSVNQHFGSAPSTTGINQQFGIPLRPGMNQQFRQTQPSNLGMNQQFGQVQPSNTGINQQFGQLQPSSTGMNQQFGQAPPSSTNMNSQFGKVQPSNTGTNHQFGQAPLSTNMNQQFVPSQGNQLMGPSLPMPTGAASRPTLGAGGPNIPTSGSIVGPGVPNSNNDWFGGKASVTSTGPTSQVLNRGASPSTPSVASNPLSQLSAFSKSAAEGPKGLASSGNQSTSDPFFGGDMFSANQSPAGQISSAQQPPASSLPTSSAIVPATSASEPSSKPDPFEALQSTVMKPSTGFRAPQTPSMPKSNQQVPSQVTSASPSSGVPAGVRSSTLEQPQESWPKMSRPSIQKYAKVFMEVDTDRDGRITGLEARNLFLSWKLPREVLKQVWDLSDQDSDSMLSLREFCVALYLMERYREGRPLPPTLPHSVMLDETLVSLAGPPIGHGTMGWAPTAGFVPQPGAKANTPAGLRPPVQPAVSQADGSVQFNQPNSRGPIDNSHLLSNGQDNSLDAKDQEATETNENVENTENVLLDSREKLEFYRTKMQDLVLYKSRCDNRLNEITERARADKQEAELLEKKFQEKYKQVAEIHSKLTIEEAQFREVQERKVELQQAITRMEQGGSADGILQVRADRIQSDLEELLKALADRCKKHSVKMKSAAVIELPPGWTPGVPEFAALWDEEWDKFDDEGFSFDVAVPGNDKSAPVNGETSSPTRSVSPDSVLNADATSEKPFTPSASPFETESVYSADESKSPRGSPRRQTTYESPSQEHPENHSSKSFDGDTDTHRSFDESTWGKFDDNDDIDSVWGFNAKDSDHGKHDEKYFFGADDFGASPRRTDSPKKKSPFVFEDSVPSSPLSRAGNSPPRHSIESRDPFFDSFSRYDSFSAAAHGGSSSPRRESFSRFDSISSTTGRDNFSRFDSFSSTTGNHTRFDSMSSTSGFDHNRNYSFDDPADPFGSSGPFKVTSETPKKHF